MNERRRTVLVSATVLAILAFGLLAEWLAFGPDGYVVAIDTTYQWALDLITGLVMTGCGAIGLRRRPNSLVGPLLILAAVAWFGATLIEPPRGVSTVFAPSIVHLYRGFLAHVIITFPTGRPADRVDWVAVAIGYAASFLAPAWSDPMVGLLLMGGLVAVAWRAERHARGWARSARRDALGVAILFAAAVAVVLAGTSVGLPYPFDDILVMAFHIVLMAGVVRLTRRLVDDQPALTDLVVELGGTPYTTLGHELGELLGDAKVRVGFWDDSRAAYLDELGLRVDPPAAHTASGFMRIDQDGQPVALVAYQPGTIDDPGGRRAVGGAVRLAAANLRLRTQVRDQVAQLAASRRRLIVAADAEGERLARRLRDGTMHHLEVVGVELLSAGLAIDTTHGSVGAGATEDPAAMTVALKRAEYRLERTLGDLRDFALGLAPRPLSAGGLRGGLVELARECPLPVDLRVDAEDLPPALAADAYLVCAEALANVSKHAHASGVRVWAAVVAGELRLEIKDDGTGGASLGGGSGLRGLIDRVASLGGSTTLDSRPGAGTVLSARWPVEEAPSEASTTSGMVGSRSATSLKSRAFPDAVPMDPS